MVTETDGCRRARFFPAISAHADGERRRPVPIRSCLIDASHWDVSDATLRSDPALGVSPSACAEQSLKINPLGCLWRSSSRSGAARAARRRRRTRRGCASAPPARSRSSSGQRIRNVPSNDPSNVPSNVPSNARTSSTAHVASRPSVGTGAARAGRSPTKARGHA